MSDSTLTCRDLVKAFGGVTAVRGVSTVFPSGRVTALVGPNGAGKSTLFNICTGVLRPDEGQVELRGHRVDGRPAWQIARMGIGRLFQDARIFPRLTVLENVCAAFPNQSGENLFQVFLRPLAVKRQQAAFADRARQLLDLVGLAGREAEPAGRLSFGQQKLLGLARLWAADSRVLLLDEPTAGTSPAVWPTILSLVRKAAAEGRVVAVIEHHIAFVRECADRVVFMQQGRITADGPPDEVLDDAEIRDVMLGL